MNYVETAGEARRLEDISQVEIPGLERVMVSDTNQGTIPARYQHHFAAVQEMPFVLTEETQRMDKENGN